MIEINATQLEPVTYTHANGEVQYFRWPSGVCYHVETPPEVVRALENARANGERVRLFYGDRETGRDWLEEHDLTGRIGRSTGSIKVPLIIANERSSGGPAILDHCIVRIMQGGREVYRHPHYYLPSFSIKPEGGRTSVLAYGAGYPGGVHATFDTDTKARRWLAFIKGERATR